MNSGDAEKEMCLEREIPCFLYLVCLRMSRWHLVFPADAHWAQTDTAIFMHPRQVFPKVNLPKPKGAELGRKGRSGPARDLMTPGYMHLLPLPRQ